MNLIFHFYILIFWWVTIGFIILMALLGLIFGLISGLKNKSKNNEVRQNKITKTKISKK